jgi:hypothetical protein
MTTAEIILAGVAAVMGGGNAWNWLAGRGKTKVDLITLAQSIAAETIKALKDREDALLERIGELEGKMDDMSAHIASLENVIRDMGATPPPRPAPRPRTKP